MIEYTHCPVCGDPHIFPVFPAEDFTVSHEIFEIWACKQCTIRFTQKVPDMDRIGAYYQSDKYISHSDTSRGLINYLYHQVRKKTLLSKKKLIQKYTGISSGHILDIGCGTGAFLHIMKQSGWYITGLEPDKNAAAKAAELYGIHPQNPGELYKLPAGSFDAITLWHVLEHVHDLHGYMEQLKNLLKPGGILFIAVPNYTSHDAIKYGQFWAAYDVPRHLYHFSPAAMEKMHILHKLKIFTKLPMWFDSFYVSMLSEQYRHGKSNPFLGAVTGAFSNIKALFNKDRCSSLIYISRRA